MVNFDDSVADVVISARVDGAPASDTRAALRVVRGPGVYGRVNVAFQVTVQGSRATDDTAVHITPSSGVVTFLDRQVGLYGYHLQAISLGLLYCWLLPFL